MGDRPGLLGSLGDMLYRRGPSHSGSAPFIPGSREDFFQNKLPRSYFAGGGTAISDTDDITIAVGEFRDSFNVTDILNTRAGGLKKQIDATWAAGDDAGGLNATDFASGSSGTEPDTTYHIFLIKHKDGTVDAGFDKSVSATNLLGDSGYTYSRRVGSLRTDSTAAPNANIIPYTQRGDRFLLSVPALGYTNTAQNYTGGVALTLDIVPLGIDIVGLLRVFFTAAETDQGMVLSPIVETSAAPSLTAAPLMNFNPNAVNDAVMDIDIDVDTAGQIRARVLTDTSVDLHIVVRGWEDTRGRDD